MEVVRYLNASGIGATAYYEVPADRPGEFLVVERTGGARSGRAIERATLDVQCWASKRPVAADMARKAALAVEHMPEALENVFGASVTSTYRDTDLESGTPRYHVVCEITTCE